MINVFKTRQLAVLVGDCRGGSLLRILIFFFRRKNFPLTVRIARAQARQGFLVFRSQGRYFSGDEIKRIIMLLRESDMSLPEIANRMNCSRSAVAEINRKFNIRLYEGRRRHWNLNRRSLLEHEEEMNTAPRVTSK